MGRPACRSLPYVAELYVISFLKGQRQCVCMHSSLGVSKMSCCLRLLLAISFSFCCWLLVKAAAEDCLVHPCHCCRWTHRCNSCSKVIDWSHITATDANIAQRRCQCHLEKRNCPPRVVAIDVSILGSLAKAIKLQFTSIEQCFMCNNSSGICQHTPLSKHFKAWQQDIGLYLALLQQVCRTLKLGQSMLPSLA